MLGKWIMKKVFIGLVLIIVLGCVGASFFFGGEAENQFKHSVKAFDKALQDKMLQVPSSPQVNLVVKDYDKGIFSSSAKLRVKVDLSAMPMPLPRAMSKISYDLDLKINHGPFILSLMKPGMAYVESSAQLPKNIIDKVKQQLSKDSTLPQLDLSFFLNLDESSMFKTSIPTFTIIPKQFPGKLIWKGMDMTYNMSKDFTHVYGTSVMNGIDFKSPFANADVSQVQMTSDLRASDYGLWVGTGSFNVPSIRVSARGQNVFDLSKFKLDSSANIKEGLLELSMSSSLASITSKAKSFGPANMVFMVKNLDAKALADVQGVLQQLKDARRLPKDKVEDLTQKLDVQFPKLLARGAELSLSNANFKMPQGLLSASLNIKVPAGIKVTKSMDLVEHVQAKGSLKTPVVLVKKQLFRQAFRQVRYQQRILQRQARKAQSLAALSNDTGVVRSTESPKRMTRMEMKKLAKQKVENQLNKLLGKQLLIQEDDAYLLKFTFNKGHLFVNEKAFTPDMLEQ